MRKKQRLKIYYIWCSCNSAGRDQKDQDRGKTKAGGDGGT